MPAAWTTAVLTFQASRDGVTYREQYASNGSAISQTVGAGQSVLFGNDLSGQRYLKIRSGTLASPVNQDTTRAIRAGVGVVSAIVGSFRRPRVEAILLYRGQNIIW